MRQRSFGPGARRRGGELSDPAGAIRPAVEAALALAREGLAADPVVPPPQALRRYLGFSKLSPGALRAIARVVERDEAFRERVAARTDEEAVGRAGWLWLRRPEGWADELGAIEDESAARAEEERRERDERSAVKKLAAAQAAAAQASSEAEERAREVDTLRAGLARQRVQQAEVGERLAAAESESERLAAARSEVVRKLKEVEARLVERSTELNAAKARIRELEKAGGAGSDRAPPGDGPEPEPGRAASREIGGGMPPDGPGRETVGGPPPEALAHELSRAAAGAASLADSLVGLAALFEPGRPGWPGPRAPGVGGPGDLPPGGTGDVAGADRAVGATPPGTGSQAGAGPGSPAPPRRVPLRLPGGVFDDSVEAAEHLLRAGGVVLVVDGYNVTMEGWPALAPAPQRRRLVAALAEVAARTATQIEIVFDGADVGTVAVPAPVRSLVHVRFSPPGVEADDVVLDLVGQLPPARPVVVASSDNQVRDGARSLGANLVHARQLLDALRR